MGQTIKGKKRGTATFFQKPNPPEILKEFIALFTSRGWLNQTLRIRRGDRRYRITCSETGFFAYRINDSHGISPGFPGWPVCLVTLDLLTDDLERSRFCSTEPDARDWLRHLMEDDIDLI
jgi:hypothetical protein